MSSLPPVTSWKRLFADRSSGSWSVMITAALLILLSLFLTRLNATSIQKIMVVGLSIISMWQLYRYKNIDLMSLLIAALGLYILFSFNRSELLSVIYLMILSGILGALLTIWQGHGRFTRSILWRHAYLVGLFTAQTTALFGFWVVFDDSLAKAVLSAVSLYVWWGLLDLSARNALQWRFMRGYIMLALLLAATVLVTIKPVQSVGIHS